MASFRAGATRFECRTETAPWLTARDLAGVAASVALLGDEFRSLSGRCPIDQRWLERFQLFREISQLLARMNSHFLVHALYMGLNRVGRDDQLFGDGGSVSS